MGLFGLYHFQPPHASMAVAIGLNRQLTSGRLMSCRVLCWNLGNFVLHSAALMRKKKKRKKKSEGPVSGFNGTLWSPTTKLCQHMSAPVRVMLTHPKLGDIFGIFVFNILSCRLAKLLPGEVFGMDKAVSKKPCQVKCRAGGSPEVPPTDGHFSWEIYGPPWTALAGFILRTVCSFYVLFLRTPTSHMYTLTGMYVYIYIYFLYIYIYYIIIRYAFLLTMRCL